MKPDPIEKKIYDLIEPIIVDMGLSLYWVCVARDSTGNVAQIMAENPESGKISVGECEKISHEVSAVMDVEDPINGSYFLEVSSPGIDRFIVRGEDYNNYKGFDVKIELDKPFESESGIRKRYRGKIIAFEDGIVKLEVDSQQCDIDFDNIKRSKLVLCDELIKKV